MLAHGFLSVTGAVDRLELRTELGSGFRDTVGRCPIGPDAARCKPLHQGGISLHRLCQRVPRVRNHGRADRSAANDLRAGEIAVDVGKGVGFCLAYIDCDDFKQVNDKFGHAEGDRLLQAIAGVSVETLRRSDTIGRLGGDEFAVILPETEQRDALFVIDKLQHKLRAITRLRRRQVSFSIGVAVFRTIPGSATLAMEFADRLMYAAKKQGKGVTVWNVFGDAKSAPVVWHIGVAGARPAQRASGVSPLSTT
ncbi:MAG: GGDEF domain-containing protein [Betaproteobacteria bacterium]|nr:MAG: GGDEF domain-containing protein [Betaproteobacteria bacterium]